MPQPRARRQQVPPLAELNDDQLMQMARRMMPYSRHERMLIQNLLDALEPHLQFTDRQCIPFDDMQLFTVQEAVELVLSSRGQL